MICRCLCLAACGFSPWASAQPEWSADFGGPASSVRAVLGWDEDGPGPVPWALFVAGSTYGPTEGQSLVRWDGRLWTALGGGITGSVSALALFDDGAGEALYAAGSFKDAGGTPAGGIARWDGQAWTPAGSGLTEGGGFACLAAYDADGDGPGAPSLYAGGWFAYIDGQWCKYIARWDGVRWWPVGGGMNDFVIELTVWDPDDAGPETPLLIAAGTFREAGGLTAEHIASWNGKKWGALGGGVNGPVNGLAVFGANVLYAGGDFTTAGGSPSPGVGAWDGVSWMPVPGLLQDGNPVSVRGLAPVDPDGDGPIPRRLYAGGEFKTADGARDLASWDGQEWHAAPTPETSPNWLGVADEDGPGPSSERLLIQGGYSMTTIDDAQAGIATFERGADNIVSRARVLDLDGDGPERAVLMLTGEFRSCGMVSTPGIAGWDGQRFLAFGQGFTDEWGYQAGLNDIAMFDADGEGPEPAALYASGTFWNKGQSFGPLVRWDGAGWTLVAEFDDSTGDLEVFDADGAGPDPARLYVGGSMGSIEGLTLHNIASWDGQEWDDVGGGVVYSPVEYYDWVRDLVIYDFDGEGPELPRLVVGGHFDSAGGIAASHLAVWDGQSWRAIGDSPAEDPDSSVDVLETHDPDGPGQAPPALVVAGGFDVIGGIPASGIALLDAGGWTALGAGLSGVNAVATHDDGSGPALYAAGSFDGAIARWDGGEWSVLGSGLEDRAYAAAPFDDDGAGPMPPALYVGGRFNMAGDIWTDRIARWGSPAGACAADCDDSGGLDLFDFLCFVTAFNAGDPVADCDASGGLDVFDFLCFVNAFNKGC
jgi:hypothetical protein